MRKLGAKVLIGGMLAGAAILATAPVAVATASVSSSEARAMSYWVELGWRPTLAHCQADGRREVNQNGALGYYCQNEGSWGWTLHVEYP